MRFKNRKPKKSLRTLLVGWFLFMSLAPTMFVTGVSVAKYEEGINAELVQRLRSNSREFVARIGDYEKYLLGRRQRHKSDLVLSTLLATNSYDRAKSHILSSSRNTPLSRVNVFDRSGDSILSVDKEQIAGGAVAPVQPEFSLSEPYLRSLADKSDLNLLNFSQETIELISTVRIDGKNGRAVGYIEEIITLEPSFLESLKSRLGIEIVVFDGTGSIVSWSHPDFALYRKDFFAKTISKDSETLFELPIRTESFGFIISKIPWGDKTLIVGIGASKQKAKAILKNVNYAFFSVIAGVGLLSIVLSLVMARIILRPLNDLLDGIQTMDTKNGPVEIPINTENEIGVVTDSFNDLSQRVWQGKKDLEKKISELQQAYSTLSETQARLVHTAKMASLGQMVAGVAHELNNPIGFIYANMTHLKDYADRLIKLVGQIEKNPQQAKKSKEEAEFEYLVEDMPRLIKSCEDGAKRTRDIVLGLRNFSRLEEASLKRVSVKVGIEATLGMLSGELKNRIEVHTEFQEVPEVMCYASELNQVFVNLISNAAQAIEGEGDIWISVAGVSANQEPEQVRISIRDSGKGMSKEIMEKIFDPFFTTKSVGQGTGLGLSISYGIVKKHNGEIFVKSELGKGTEFTILLPVDGPPQTKVT